jgi:23S rRNA (cytidine2498-2'-O)-methyltransferase
MIERLEATVYRAARGFEAELYAELGDDAAPIVEGGRLFLAPGPRRPAAWATNVWIDPVRIRFESLAGGAMALLSLGKKWFLDPVALFDRAALIEKQLPAATFAPLAFPAAAPDPCGAWTLAKKNEILASARTTSPFPNGEAVFVEDRQNPPSRAYLKLWEALTLLGKHPRRGDHAVDLGSSPGGWTWALQRLGAHVVSIDKAPLAPRVAALPRIDFRRASAFGIDPGSIERVDWLVSDVICFPKKIVALVERWLGIYPNASYVVTVKFQGVTDMTPLAELRTIPGSRLVHLHHNRHELTWMK